MRRRTDAMDPLDRDPLHDRSGSETRDRKRTFGAELGRSRCPEALPACCKRSGQSVGRAWGFMTATPSCPRPLGSAA